MPEPSISTCMAGSVTIRKTSDGLAATVRLAAIRSSLDMAVPPLPGVHDDTSDQALRPADTVPEMGEAHESWEHAVKEQLKPLRDRVVRGLGGTMPEPPPRGLTYDQLVQLLYPTLPDDLRPSVDEAAAGDLARVSTIRRMLGTIEHQVAPTAFSVQLTEGDAVRCTVGGVELFCDAADAAVTPGLLSGHYEPHLSAVFEKYCTSGMTVVDVGANLGYYSLLASRLVGPSGRVIALEPNSENCRLLLSSLRLNGSSNVQLLPVAADRAQGWAYYSTHVGSNGGLIDDGELLSHPGPSSPPSASTTWWKARWAS